MSDGNKLVDARVTCLKTGLIRSDPAILRKKLKFYFEVESNLHRTLSQTGNRNIGR